MVDTKHIEAIETGITAFDQIVQDIRELRETQDSRALLHRRARSAETEIPPEESLPLFLSTPDQPPADQGADARPQGGWDQDDARQDPRYQDLRYQDLRNQDARTRDTRFERIGYQDAPLEDDTWLRDALETGRERVEAEATPTVFRRMLKPGIAATSLVAVLVTLFVLQDHRTLITDARASLASVLPGFSGTAEPAAPATPQLAEAKPPPAAPVAPAAPMAVAPTREAIASAYQTALRSQPEIRQPPVAPPPPPAPAVRRLDPDELAGLLKRAQGMLDTGDLSGARLLLERAADAHEARAAFLLAQTYDPAVLGTSDSRSITPDPDAARSWYRKAAEFGSQEAQQRLAQMN